jgi:hypothetical protein
MTLVLATFAACSTELKVEPPAPPPAPTLGVLLVVDQLPTRLMDAVSPAATGGLRRLAEGYTAVGRHRHLGTETCPGHATLSTGASPNKTGIPSNGWLEGGVRTYCIPATLDASRLRADTLADRVTDAGGRVVSLGPKDRAAIMLGGHHPTAAVWLDRKAGAVQGTHLEAVGPLPDWKCTGTRTWSPLPEQVARYAARMPDDQPFESLPATFPHESPCDDPSGWLTGPDGGTWVVDAAIAATDHLSLGQTPGRADLLALSFSNVDYVGHTYTPDSWEAQDVMLRLDLDLARLFAHLDATVGEGRWTVALSSDHGAPAHALAIPMAAMDATLKRATAAAGGEVVFDDPWVWMPPGATPAQRAALLGVLRGLSEVPGVMAVADPADRTTWPADAKVAEALALGTVPGRSGDFVVLRSDGFLWSAEPQVRGITHGSTDDRDQRVPIWFWGAGVAPGHSERDLDTRQVAPTLATLLGLPVPKDAQLPLVREAVLR